MKRRTRRGDEKERRNGRRKKGNGGCGEEWVMKVRRMRKVLRRNEGKRRRKDGEGMGEGESKKDVGEIAMESVPSCDGGEEGVILLCSPRSLLRQKRKRITKGDPEIHVIEQLVLHTSHFYII